jgi:hypothetical protein
LRLRLPTPGLVGSPHVHSSCLAPVGELRRYANLPPPAGPPVHDLPTAKRCMWTNSTTPVRPSWRHLAVGPTPPADWGTRSNRSHLGKRRSAAPNTRSLIFVHGAGWARGCAPFWSRSPREGLGPKGVWVRVGSWRGSCRQHRRGPGAPEGAPHAEGKGSPQKLAR